MKITTEKTEPTWLIFLELLAQGIVFLITPLLLYCLIKLI